MEKPQPNRGFPVLKRQDGASTFSDHAANGPDACLSGTCNAALRQLKFGAPLILRQAQDKQPSLKADGTAYGELSRIEAAPLTTSEAGRASACPA